MILRNRFLITALLLCHQLTAHSLVTRQLPSSKNHPAEQEAPTPASTPASTCAAQAAQVEDPDIPTICSIEQEKDGPIYKLRGNVEIHYRAYIVRADEV